MVDLLAQARSVVSIINLATQRIFALPMAAVIIAANAAGIMILMVAEGRQTKSSLEIPASGR